MNRRLQRKDPAVVPVDARHLQRSGGFLARILAAFFCVAGGACARHEPVAMAQATPEPRIVCVVVTPTAGANPEVTAATPIPAARPELEVHSSEIVRDLPTPVPTVDVASIPNPDREKPAAPKSLTDKMKQCLSYTVTAMHDLAIVGGTTAPQLRVRVDNACDVSFSTSDSRFEARARDYRGAVIGREVGMFRQEIPGRGNAETVLQLEGCCPVTSQPRFEASVWWAAGGGKRPNQ